MLRKAAVTGPEPQTVDLPSPGAAASTQHKAGLSLCALALDLVCMLLVALGTLLLLGKSHAWEEALLVITVMCRPSIKACLNRTNN